MKDTKHFLLKMTLKWTTLKKKCCIFWPRYSFFCPVSRTPGKCLEERNILSQFPGSLAWGVKLILSLLRTGVYSYGHLQTCFIKLHLILCVRWEKGLPRNTKKKIGCQSCCLTILRLHVRAQDASGSKSTFSFNFTGDLCRRDQPKENLQQTLHLAHWPL